MSKIANVLKSLRVKEGLTQEELANKMNISRSTIGMYEQGKRTPPPDILELFADFFNVDIYIILYCNIMSHKINHNFFNAIKCTFLYLHQ